jgi:tetratricopeptide (TPR) repeat protein
MRRFLPLLAMLCAAPAQAEWWEARTDHFIVFSEGAQKDVRAFAEKLERYDQSLRSLQKVKPDNRLSDSRKVTIYRSGDIKDVAALAGAPGSGIAGFYIPRASGPVAFVPSREEIKERSLYTDAGSQAASTLDAQTVLFHEYAHHFMFRHFAAAYPSWYVEGLAETYSTIEFKDGGKFHIGNPPQARAQALFGGLNYSIKRMLMTSQKPDFTDVIGRYTYGWLLTHYLTFDTTRQGQLLTYLRLINSGTSMSDAAVKAFGDLGRLESDVQAYLRKRPLPGALVQPGTYTEPKVDIRALGPDEAAIMKLRSRSKVGVTRKTAKDVARDAEAVAARYPGSYLVQMSLAEAELDAESLDAADRAADAAIAARPDSAEALYYKGNIALERAKKDPASFAIARSWFQKANAADPDHPGPLIGTYQTYTRARQAAPESALIGLEKAYTLAPYDRDLRITLAGQLLSEQKGDIARDLLIPLALAPHESKQAKAMSEVVDLIEANKLADARQKLAARVAEEEDEKSGKKKKGD